MTAVRCIGRPHRGTGAATSSGRGWTAPLYWELDGAAWTTFTLHGRVEIDAHTPMCHLSFFEADAYARWANARLPTEFEWEHAADWPLPGAVWEWTSSAYLPYPRFAPFAGDLGEYNGKFMSGQVVLRGGSALTPASHIRRTYRNFFPPQARWQMSGIRLARWD